MTPGELVLPSGRKFDVNGIHLIRECHRVGVVRFSEEPDTTNSGVPTRFYVYGRADLTLNPRVLCHVGSAVTAKAQELATAEGVDVHKRMVCLLGIPEAGQKFASSATHRSYPPVCYCTVRSKAKSHGPEAGHIVEGRPDLDLYYYMTVDNALTSGKALLKWLRRIGRDGYPVKDMIHLVFVDRGQGGRERLAKMGYRVESIFTLYDLVNAFILLGLWPSNRLAILEHELETYRFDR